MKHLSEIGNIKNKKILVRVDFNVPIFEGNVIDNTKIKATLSTIKYLVKKGAQVVLITHLGRPRQKRVTSLSVEPIVKEVSKLLKKEILFCSSLQLKEIKKTVNKLQSKEVLLLQNIRFSKYELELKSNYAQTLSDMFDAFVFDGFGVAHRSTMSTVGLTKYLPSYAGLLLQKEIEILQEIKNKKGGIFIIGGAKIKTKLPTILHLVNKGKKVLVGGAIINSYLHAKGYKVGNSYRTKYVSSKIAMQLDHKKIVLPIDVVVEHKDGTYSIVDIKKDKKLCQKEDRILDIGPKTIVKFIKLIEKSSSVIFNGPLGFIEKVPYNIGSVAIASEVANVKKRGGTSVIGGGETIQVFNLIKKQKKVTYISTGGGAMLTYLSQNELPAIKALKQNSFEI